VLSATAERLQAQGDRANAPILRMLTEQMNERIDYQLRIARLRFRTRALGVHASLSDTVLRSVAVLRKAPSREHISWLVDIGPGLEVNMDGHDLMELIGILLENAQQWAAQQVRVRASRTDDAVELLIEDDGKGLSDEQIARLGTRGIRLDEGSGGDGLGLAIAMEITRLNRVDLSLSRSVLGGLSARLRFAVGEAGAP
jgi:signal transduction histidine kinase